MPQSSAQFCTYRMHRASEDKRRWLQFLHAVSTYNRLLRARPNYRVRSPVWAFLTLSEGFKFSGNTHRSRIEVGEQKLSGKNGRR